MLTKSVWVYLHSLLHSELHNNNNNYYYYYHYTTTTTTTTNAITQLRGHFTKSRSKTVAQLNADVC